MNNNDCLIRLERPEDHAEVENMVRDSFWNVYRPGCLEHWLLHVMRDDPDFVPELDVVMALDVERGSSDLLILLGLRNRTDLYSRFLLPAMNQGLIEYTIPDKPNSRLQKYRLAPRGKATLKAASTAS